MFFSQQCFCEKLLLIILIQFLCCVLHICTQDLGLNREAPVTPPSLPHDYEKKIQPYGIYHSLKDIVDVLYSKEYRDRREVKELLQAYKYDCSEGNFEIPPVYNKTGKWPLIAIEGVQTSGKLAVSRRVTEILQADFLTTPPDCLFHLRSTFENMNGTLRSLYYSLCNYALANQAIKRMPMRAVVANRFWHSQASFALSVAEADGYIIPGNSDLYKWPKDLLVPDIIFFLQYSHSRQGDPQPSLRTMTRRFRERMTIQFMRMKRPELTAVFETQMHRQIGRILRVLTIEYPNKFDKIVVHDT